MTTPETIYIIVREYEFLIYNEDNNRLLDPITIRKARHHVENMVDNLVLGISALKKTDRCRERDIAVDYLEKMLPGLDFLADKFSAQNAAKMGMITANVNEPFMALDSGHTRYVTVPTPSSDSRHRRGEE